MLERAKKIHECPKLLLAPLFLFSAYFLIPNQIYVNKLLPIGGIFLCVFFQKKGFYLAALLVFIDSIFQHLASGSHFWLIGFEMSLILSFWIFHTTYESIRENDGAIQAEIRERELAYDEVQKQMDEKVLQYQNATQTLENEREDLSLSLENIQSEMKSFLQLIDTLRCSKELEIETRENLSKELMGKRQKINELEQEIVSYKEKLTNSQNVQSLEKERRDLINELNHFRVKQFQTSLINEAFAYFTNQEIEKIRTLSFDKKNYQKTRQLMANYNQLKKQFKEKDKILHLTRKEIYDSKTQYEALKNTLYELKLKPKNMEKELLHQIDDLLLENERLLRENKELEMILEKALVKDCS